MRFFAFHADGDRSVRVAYCTGWVGSSLLRSVHERRGGKLVPARDVDLLAARLARRPGSPDTHRGGD
jgi:hypothetical protein